MLSCKETDCNRKVLAREMCPTHYSYWRRSSVLYEHTCTACGAAYTKNRKDSGVCSMRCRQDLATIGKAKARATCTDIVKYRSPRVWVGHTVEPRNGSPLVAGRCAYCPAYFVGHGGSVYCSSRCKMNAKVKRRYDTLGEFKVTDSARHSIYMRDGYMCKLCNEPIDLSLHFNDPMSATLDHIIPQSWTLIPDHSPANLRTAHRRCNSVRGAGA